MAEVKREPKQINKFRETARELECDEDEAAFKAKLKAVAKAPATGDQHGKKK